MPAKDDTVSFARFLFDAQRGFAELCYAPGDPQDRSKGVKRLGWYEWPREAAIIAEDAVELAERYGDVYIGSTLYREEKRDEEYAQPSRIIFVDDAPAGSTYSACVRTSEESRHGYLYLREAVEQSVRADLQRRAAYALGADHSGWDVTQLVRLPIGDNTKGGGQYPVHLEHPTKSENSVCDVGEVLANCRTYTVTELEAMFPVTQEAVAPHGEYRKSGELLTQEAQYWIDHIDQLLKEGKPRRMRPGAQGYRLTDRTLEFSDTSTPRYVFAVSLVLHGYPDDEAMALMLHFTAEGSERKGEEWLYEDCRRCLEKARAVHPNVEIHPTQAYKPRQFVESQPPEEYKPDERRTELRRMLANWCMEKADGRIFYDLVEIAERFGVCVRTIQADLAMLEDAGKITRHQLPGPGGRPWINLEATFWGLPSDSPTPSTGSSQTEAVQMPQNADAAHNAYGRNTHDTPQASPHPPKAVQIPQTIAFQAQSWVETVEKIHCVESPQSAVDTSLVCFRERQQASGRGAPP